MMTTRLLRIGRAAGVAAMVGAASVSMVSAQTAARLSILQAEDRRAASAKDLATIRSGARSGDPATALTGLRALGRLERPALINDILPGLRHRLPEVRAEAANAVAQAAQGWRTGPPAGPAIGSVQSSLIARLTVEAEPQVRTALCEAIGRLPYRTPADVARAETALLDVSRRAVTEADQLGVARALEALVRLTRDVQQPGEPVIQELKRLVRGTGSRSDAELRRDSRVRRLALEGLMAAQAVDADILSGAAADPDPQVRRLAVRAATMDGAESVVTRGLADPAPMVRIEALRTSRVRDAQDACTPALAAASDPEVTVALVAIDQMAACSHQDDTIAYLADTVSRSDQATRPRSWHRAAHAIVALAAAAPDRAAAALAPLVESPVWQLRMYAARAAAVLGRDDVLESLVHDANDNVVEAAISGLSATRGHEADRHFASALTRDGYQVVRAAALALDASPAREVAVPALKAALARADSDGRPAASDARSAIRATLASLGNPVPPARTGAAAAAPLTLADLRRLAAPRARFTIRDVGQFDVALFTTEAPATVLRFAQSASGGYYDGLAFHRVVPNGIVQGGGTGDNEYSGDVPFMRDEVGLWPHVRGALGISTRGRDTGDGQVFIDLVDNPRYDHVYTVFAQVLNGMDVVDRILEGDIIERVEILP